MQEAEVVELGEEWVDLIRQHKVDPTTSKPYNAQWFWEQLKLYEKDFDDLGEEARRSIRQVYDKLSHTLPRDICGFLYKLIYQWCVGDWEEGTTKPSNIEVNMYLTIANAFPFENQRFSHFTVIEQLEKAYEYMVDKGFQDVPGVSALSTSYERHLLRSKAIRRWIREHEEEVGKIKPEEAEEKKDLLEKRLEKPIW